jgi:hypothetical protein
VLRLEPDGEVKIGAFVPELDAGAPEVAEARDLLPQRPGNRADHRHCLHLRKRSQRIGHDVGGDAELALALELPLVLLLDIGRAHPHPKSLTKLRRRANRALSSATKAACSAAGRRRPMRATSSAASA